MDTAWPLVDIVVNCRSCSFPVHFTHKQQRVANTLLPAARPCCSCCVSVVAFATGCKISRTWLSSRNMDNQFAAPSALDDNERHYIGNLLSDDDAFSTAFKTEKEKVKTIHAPNANSNLPGPFQPIGPSPNGAFWPEPPPPYSAAVGVSTFCNTGKPFEVLQPLKPTMLASPYNNSFYPEKKIFDGLSFGAMEQTYETLGLNDSLTVKVDHETDSNVWSLSKDSSPLEQSPKTSHYDEEDRNANNLSPLSNQEINPPIAAIQATQPKVWPKQNAREKKAAKAGSVDRTVNQRLQGSGNSNANSDFRKIIRKKGARAQPTPATPVTNSAASSNNHSPSKKRSESVATIEPLHADRHDISAGVVVHAPAIKMDSASRFEVLQSLPPSPTKKRTVVEKAEVKKEKEPTEKKASEDVTPAKNSERNKRRGIHHKLIGSVSQSRSASKKPIPVTAVGTTTASCTSTTKKTGSPQLSGGVIRVIFHIALALLTVAVEFVVHQISKLIFATVFFIQRGWNFAIETLHNLCIMTEQLLCNISAYTQHVLRRMLVTREERLALFLAKEPSPSLQDLDDHFFLECNETYSTNRPLPRDAESLLERLYKCFYADPYVVLGLTRKCTDEDIAQYYTAQAALVDPGKITMHACAQAYDLLTYAYAAIGTPNERESYDNLTISGHILRTILPRALNQTTSTSTPCGGRGVCSGVRWIKFCEHYIATVVSTTFAFSLARRIHIKHGSAGDANVSMQHDKMTSGQSQNGLDYTSATTLAWRVTFTTYPSGRHVRVHA
uniref:J domain-containing protein n=1 Tax=Steinernema glaseri TaxID=37863 RepID=A0A1I7ZN34_9BILA